MSQRMCLVDRNNDMYVIKDVKESVENSWHQIVQYLHDKKRDLIISVEYTDEYCCEQGWKFDGMLVERLLDEYNKDFVGTDKWISLSKV